MAMNRRVQRRKPGLIRESFSGSGLKFPGFAHLRRRQFMATVATCPAVLRLTSACHSRGAGANLLERVDFFSEEYSS